MKPRFFVLPTLLFAVACGGSATTPWDGTAKVRSADGTVDEVAPGDCVKLANGDCVDTTSECGADAAADVYVDANGDVATVICYPKDGVSEVLDGTNSLPDGVDNKDFIVLEGDSENPGFVGDLDLSGNNSTLYGDDPSTAVLDGNLTVSKNNVLVSGITVTGDVSVTFNDAQFSNCVIEGDLVITGNNTIVAGCHIKGDVQVKGNNTVLTLNRIDGEIAVEGNGTDCTDNYRGESLESGEALDCKAK